MPRNTTDTHTAKAAKPSWPDPGLPVLARTPGIGVLTDGPCAIGSVAHRKTRVEPLKLGERHASKGDPSTAWPACMQLPKILPAADRWREYGTARAHELGAIACTHTACFPGGGR